MAPNVPTPKPNPFESPKTREDSNDDQSNSRTKAKLWTVLTLILLVPAILSNGIFWIGLLIEKIGGNAIGGGFALSWFVATMFIFVPVVGLIYGASIGYFLYYSRKMKNAFFHPVLQAFLQLLWFYTTVFIGCVCVLPLL